MQFYKLYNQENYSEVENLIKFCTTCNLITSDQNQIQTGLFNPIFTNGKLYLHLNKKDQQVTHMKNTNSATMVFQDVLAQFPSYWADENYAGAATTYYRYAELNCKVSFFDDPNQQIPILESMMVDYQPEGKYQKISYDNPIYTKKLDMILIADFEIIDFKAKWKLGQNRPVEFRKEISEKFRARNEGSDKRCADEIEKWIGQHCGNL
ncbi:MAG: hypothetical protein HOE90_19530 [Bacteriovoracaceae bacterium]|nr:hypothetical protein [Bacteriovoracaceae bacterium]